jgi:hypothetical protein
MAFRNEKEFAMNRKLKSERIDGVVYKYGSEWTKKLESKQHWEFYWHQQKLMEDFVIHEKKEEIIEIGVGSGFTKNYCESKGLKITTLDIDAEKKPDIIANAATYDFSKKYDHLMAFEVFEHMPYSEFEKLVFKIPEFVRHYAFISLPRNEKIVFFINLKMPKLKPIYFDWRFRSNKLKTEAHHWEINYKNYTIKRLEKLFQNAGLKIEKILKYQYIYFYALSVKKRDRRIDQLNQHK